MNDFVNQAMQKLGSCSGDNESEGLLENHEVWQCLSLRCLPKAWNKNKLKEFCQLLVIALKNIEKQKLRGSSLFRSKGSKRKRWTQWKKRHYTEDMKYDLVLRDQYPLVHTLHLIDAHQWSTLNMWWGPTWLGKKQTRKKKGNTREKFLKIKRRNFIVHSLNLVQLLIYSIELPTRVSFCFI